MQNIFQMPDNVRASFLSLKKREEAKFAKSPLSQEAIDIFWLRCERYYPDLYEPLRTINISCDHLIKRCIDLFAVIWTTAV
jgi:hypothetical protein